MPIDDNPSIPENAEVTFHYLKSSQYRVIHVDGAVGGPTPSGFLHIAMYNEHPAIPREMTYGVQPNNALASEPKKVVTKGGIVREMEADVLMNLATAIQFRDWLDGNIKLLSEQIQKNGAS